jgi:hypothetical protein
MAHVFVGVKEHGPRRFAQAFADAGWRGAPCWPPWFPTPRLRLNRPHRMRRAANESGVQQMWRLFLLAAEVLKLATTETVAREQMMHVSKNT